MIFVN